MRALRGGRGADRSFEGVGGADMAGEGLQSLFPIDDLAIIGFSAIPRRLPDILRRIRQTADAAIAARPGRAGDHRRAGVHASGGPARAHGRAAIPIVDYVSPSVWAWRPWRARAMRHYVDHVLALLPFEPAAHERLGGPPCTYVGHPLSGPSPGCGPTGTSRRRDSAPPVLLALPGSRGGEIYHHSSIFGETLKLVKERVGASSWWSRPCPAWLRGWPRPRRPGRSAPAS